MSTIVLGLGNPYQGDDSAGPRVARTLRDLLPSTSVIVEEASIGGLDILEVLSGYDKAIIIDAIDTEKGTPGTIYRLEMDDIAINYNVSSHEMDFITAIELGRKIGLSLPLSITIFAIETGQTAYPQKECTPPISAAIPLCADMIIRELQTKHRQTAPAAIINLE